MFSNLSREVKQMVNGPVIGGRGVFFSGVATFLDGVGGEECLIFHGTNTNQLWFGVIKVT